MEEKIAEKLGEMVSQQYGLGALIVLGLASVLVTVYRESRKLREEVAYQVSRDLLSKRIDAYGGLWAKMKTIAIYGKGQFGPTDVATMREDLAGWYFSSNGGLLLTTTAREFYFSLQDLLAELNGLENPSWHCASRPNNAKQIFVDIIKAAEPGPLAESIVADLDQPDNLSPKQWRRSCAQISAHLVELAKANAPAAADKIFASVQQISSVLRSILAHDVRSRLDIQLPTR